MIKIHNKLALSTLTLLLLIAASILVSTGLWLNSEAVTNSGMMCLGVAAFTSLALMRGSR
jgi:hypothetical protein